MKFKLLYLFCFFFFQNSFAQQNEEFKKVKGYFDYQRYLLNQSYKKKFDETQDNHQKIEIKKTFAEIMVKMDSIQNMEYLYALIRVKNNEALQPKIISTHQQSNGEEGKAMNTNEKPAEYPGGLNELRKQVAELIYFENTDIEKKMVQADITFVVEKNGEITHVNASGANPSFNIQAEIALYLLPQYFSPAIIDKNPIRYRFRMPLSMRFD
ncbi:MAG: hypothetical protein JSS94_02505 [Bacteroidetes bacterium]|nr:hypothetical protein [Bacteroidota bacterium]